MPEGAEKTEETKKTKNLTCILSNARKLPGAIEVLFGNRYEKSGDEYRIEVRYMGGLGQILQYSKVVPGLIGDLDYDYLLFCQQLVKYKLAKRAPQIWVTTCSKNTKSFVISTKSKKFLPYEKFRWREEVVIDNSKLKTLKEIFSKFELITISSKPNSIDIQELIANKWGADGKKWPTVVRIRVGLLIDYHPCTLDVLCVPYDYAEKFIEEINFLDLNDL